MTDPIADMLARVRNASRAGHKRVDMPVSKLKAEIARILKENHFVHDFKVLDDGRHGVLRIYLMYHDGHSVIRDVQRVSKPGRRQYAGVQELPKVRNGLGMAIVYAVVRRHDGTILVDSEPGRGTRVAVYFPSARADESSGVVA